jgi:hypothetical protein
MVIIQYSSILIEALIAIIGLLIVFKKKKQYGWGIFATFLIYVFYDTSKLFSLGISENALTILFFIASISALYSVWCIYKEKKK